MRKKIAKPLIDQLKPNAWRGRLPKITPCPYCGASMSETDHAAHRAGCKRDFKDAPLQAAEFDQDPGGGYNPDGTFPQT